ncbi:hypothetical protein A6456_37980 [Paraburkholderia tropica]|nr:hemolysin activation/secretion protein [Paraburkholderia tropica]OBR54334.1 hypothetical protein A6456_37980 [Paraburkholderia tropica]
MVALAPNVQGQSLGGIETEQNQQQRRDAQQREAAVSAPAVRSTVTKIEAYPALPAETPCFRIDRFALDVPDTLPAAAHAKGASALPLASSAARKSQVRATPRPRSHRAAWFQPTP